jgi:predicted transposase/invertase (TIGR01784 family)
MFSQIFLIVVMAPISLKDDLVFKAVFVKEPRLLKNFIQEILFPDREIIVDSVIVTNPELIADYKAHKRAILDITAIDTNGNIFHVEIQNTKRPYFSARAIFYASKLIVNQIKSGEDYSVIRPVYQIILVDYRVFDGFAYTERFQLRGMTNPNHIFYDGLMIQLIDLRAIGRLKVTPAMTNAEAMLYYIANSANVPEEDMTILIDKTPDIKTINEILERMSADPETARLIEEKRKYGMDYLAEMALNYEEGELEGEYKKAVKVAQAMLAEKLSFDLIMKVTGLSLSEIERIAEGKH